MTSNDDQSVGVSVAVRAETVAYGALFAMALVTRLTHLDWMPLDYGESALALPAWQAASAAGPTTVVGAPLLHALERLAMWFLGGSTPAARIVPAVAGSLLVLAAMGLRPLIGRTAALGAAALLAVSPLWMFLGRTVAPDVVAAAAMLVLIGALGSGTRRGAAVAPVAAGLLLAADGPGLAALVALFAWALIASTRGGLAPLVDSLNALWPSDQARRRALVVFVVTLLLASTGLLMSWGGLAALISAPSRWFGALTVRGGAPFEGFALPLLVYSPVVVAFGALGCVVAARRGRAFQAFLVAWVVTSVLAGLFAGSPEVLGQALLPLTLAAGIGLGVLGESLARDFKWQEDGVMTVIVLLIVTYGLIQALAYVGEPDPALGRSASALSAGSVAMALLLLIVFGLLWGWALAGRVAALTTIVALGALAIVNGAELNHGRSDLLREAARPVYVAPGAERLAAAVTGASWTHTRDPDEWPMAVDPSLRGSLEWVLKRRDVDWSGVTVASQAPAIVVPSASTFEPESGAYRGQTHIVAGEWEPRFDGMHAFLAWYLKRAPADLAERPALSTADLYITAQ